MPEKTNNELMRFSSLPIVKLLVQVLLQCHAPSQIVLHLQDTPGILLYLQLLQDLGLMNLSSLFSASILRIQVIYHLTQRWNSPTPSFHGLQALFMADLTESLPLLLNTSQKRPLMFGLLWSLRQMEGSTVCFACM